MQYLRNLVRHDEMLRPLRKQITVNTVDAFQGQERDVVMVSLVRSNEQGQIGFLSDLRRMNVAITRARFKLIILGSKDTLCQHKFYKKLFVTIRTKPYCINKKSREIIRETFYNNKESSILFLQMGYLHEDFVVHT